MNSWRYIEKGAITVVTPPSGQATTPVVIQGVALRGGGDTIVLCRLAGTVATIVSENDTSISVIAGASTAQTGNVVLTSSFGATVTGVNLWEYLEESNIVSIDPVSGQVGTTITINGTNLLMGGTSIVEVTIAGVIVESIVSFSDTEVVVKAANGSAGRGAVVLLGDTGASTTYLDSFEYITAGYIVNISPNFGQRGTNVSIDGSTLLGGGSSVASVTFGNISVTVYLGGNDNQIQVVDVGGGVVGVAVDVVITSDSGARVTETLGWTQSPAGQIVDISPTSGQRGTRINITGTNMLGGGSSIELVTLGGVAAWVANSSDTLITAVVDTGSIVGTVDVLLQADTGALTTVVGGWQYLADGQVSAVSPPFGQHGTRATISGSGLLGGGATVESITLAGTEVLQVVENYTDDSIEIVVATSLGGPGTGDVLIVMDTGAYVIGEQHWTYLDFAEVTSISPSFGAYGTRVTINGTGLLGGGTMLVSVKLAGIEVEQIVSATNESVSVIVGANTVAGTGGVVMIADSGAVIANATGWEYISPGVIDEVIPESGQHGTIVTLRGSRLFADGTQLVQAQLAGTDAKLVTFANSTEIVLVANRSVAILGDILLVADTGGRVILEDGFEYHEEGTILSLSPESGQRGTEVTIYGTSLFGYGPAIATVTLNGNIATIVDQTDLYVVVTVPDGDPGVGDVVVTSTSGAYITSFDGWTYVTRGVIANVSPNRGQVGSIVEITGVNLLTGASQLAEVVLAGVPSSVLEYNNTYIRVQAYPSENFEAGNVTVLTDTGSYVTLVDGFQYLVAGDIDSVVPDSGQLDTVVTIEGSALLGGGSRLTSITLAGVEVQQIVNESNTLVVVIATGTATAFRGDIVLLADTGAVVTRVDGWEYLLAGNVTSIVPAAGQIGTSVTIRGDRLLAGGSSVAQVFLAGVLVSSIDSDNDDVVIVTAARGTAQTGDVLLISDTGATITVTNGWQQLVEGNVSSITPSTGHGGTFVEIVGERLRGGGSNVSSVTLGSTEATILYESETTVRVRAAISAAVNNGDVVLTSTSGAVVTLTDSWTYIVPANITSVSPSYGQRDTAVTISGERLRGAGARVTNVTLSGVEATIRSENDTTIVVIADISTTEDSSGDVRLLVDSGAQVAGVDLWEYRAEGQINSVSPDTGQIGTVVTISGVDLLGAGSWLDRVALGPNGTLGTIVSENNTQVVVVASAADAGLGEVLLVAATEATVFLPNSFEYAAEGEIVTVTPSSGQIGTRVTIIGTNLRGAGSNVETVLLGDHSVAHIAFENNTVVEVVVARANASVSAETIRLIANTGAIVTGADRWHYTEEGEVNQVQPSEGQVGTVVQILGTNLLGHGTGITSLTLDGTEVESVLDFNSTVITVVAASADQGTGDIVIVTNTGAVVNLADGFTYIVEGQIDLVTPSAGQVGTFVTISGVGMLGGGTTYDQIQLGGVDVTRLSPINDSIIVLRVPSANASGPVDVLLVSDTGSRVVLSNGWRYTEPSAISQITPASGQIGTIVILSGTNLLGAENGTYVETVKLAEVEANIASGTSGEEIVVIAAFDSTPRIGDVFVQADSGATVTVTNGWRYLEDGEVTSVDPSSGQFGTVVTIRGARMLGGGNTTDTVHLGGVLATVINATDTVIVVVAEAGNASSGDVVTIVSNTGAIVTSPAFWSYQEEGVVDTIVPWYGQLGTAVVISGSNLLGGGSELVSVRLAGVEATLNSVSSNSVATVVASASPATVDTVVLTADTGAVVTSTGNWIYRTAGNVTSVFPTSGQYGTRVTIEGTNLQAHGSTLDTISLAGIVVEEVFSQNDTHLVVRANHGPVEGGEGDIELTADSGGIITSTEVGWRYLRPASIQTVTPSSGRVGAVVTIFGVELCGGGDSIAQVELAGLVATPVDLQCGFVVVTANDYGANITGDVVVTSDTGAETRSVDAWTYIVEGEITSIEPSAGQEDTIITLTGTRLLGGGDSASSVTLADVDAFVISSNDTQIVLRSFEGPTLGGSGDVVVTGNTGVKVRLVDGWTYSAIASVTPNYGNRGTIVTITGTSLLAGDSVIAEVRLGGVEVASVEAGYNDTKIVVAAAFETVLVDQLGQVEITMANGQVVRLVNGWTNRVAGAISSVVPSSGQHGTVVEINGTDLYGYGSVFVTVTLANVEPDEIQYQDNGYLRVVVGASSAGVGEVVLVADSGAIVSLPNAWTYLVVAEIDTVSPGTGQFDTRVTISGSNLYGGGSEIVGVTLSGVAVGSIQSENSTDVIVVATDEPRYNICPATCHASCATCNGEGASDCQSCASSLRLIGGECTSICDHGFYRASGEVSAVATFRLPGIFAEIFDLEEQAVFNNTFTTLLSEAFEEQKLADSRLQDASVSTDASAMVLSVDSINGSTGLDVRLKMYGDHHYYETIDTTILNIVLDGTLLARLDNVSEAYAFAHDLERVAGTDSKSRENVCQLCSNSCDGCFRASNTHCVDCSGDLVQHGNTCLSDCPNGTFVDV
ncbi:MAG: hypothetical protein COB29_14000, partial [Sulfitobacter sp.]